MYYQRWYAEYWNQSARLGIKIADMDTVVRCCRQVAISRDGREEIEQTAAVKSDDDLAVPSECQHGQTPSEHQGMYENIILSYTIYIYYQT